MALLCCETEEKENEISLSTGVNGEHSVRLIRQRGRSETRGAGSRDSLDDAPFAPAHGEEHSKKESCSKVDCFQSS